MMRRLLSIVMLMGLVASGCSGSDAQREETTQAAPTALAAAPEPTATSLPPTATAIPTVTPAPTPPPNDLTTGLPNLDASLDVAITPAPLGTYVVAKRDAGIVRATVAGEAPRREIPVYDEPFGPPRTLVDVNAVDGVNFPINLINWDDPDGALVMRVIAGGPDDEWLIVQAPSRPHDSYVWVRASDFDFGFTDRRIEINLRGEGLLQVFDGDQAIMQSVIVQGRDSRPTPIHLTYLQKGIPGARVSPAYGEVMLSIASFSESLGTFGGDHIPSNYIHGTNQPDLMGQRVSSGSIRLPRDSLNRLVELVVPGTPVLIFEGSREPILRRAPFPATTMRFLDGADGASDGTTGLVPELWRRCELSGSRSEVDETDVGVIVEEIEEEVGVPVQVPDDDQLLCRNDGRPEFVVAMSDVEHVFAIAKPDAGEIYLTPEEADSDRAPSGVQRMIPVFDEPTGEPRALVFTNEIDGITLDYPLYAETVFGQPTVLSVLKMTTDAQWLQVRAPVLPHDTSVWVRGADFDLRSTTLRVEVDVGYEFLGRQGILSVWDGDESLLAAKISAGRESRPTTPTSTYIDQLIVGNTLAPAYGPWLFSTPSYSEALGTFGGGGLPQQSIHGIGAGLEEVMGTPSSSGSIHVTYDTILQMAELGDLVGARVVFYDSSAPETTERSIMKRPLTAAETRPIYEVDRAAPIGSFT